ncbi:Adenylate kinase 8 [Rhizophlyctis rosea]|nr:Adenylate kinase 8 [Rhizophlyctis rosea]
MDELLDRNRAEAFASYADRHELFEVFESIVSRLLIERPEDVIQFMIDQLQKPKTPAIAILGPPSTGITKVCEQIAVHYNAVHISTGALLSQAVERQTSLGMQAKPFMERGQLVPDQIMLGLVTARLQDSEVMSRGYILDGFPRTKEQAWAIQKKGILLDMFVVVDIPDQTIISLLSEIRIDPMTRREYHLTYNPPPRQIEPRLIAKAANAEPAVRARLELYRRHLDGVVGCFKDARKVRFEKGIIGHTDEVVDTLKKVLAVRKVSRAPRIFKVIIAGLPGSGKRSVARWVAEKYGYVHVSPRNVILEEISAQSHWGKQLQDSAERPEEAPEAIMLELISTRLKKKDCMDRGWILEGYPLTKTQADWLLDHDIVPNRIIWLQSSEETCTRRLLSRRYDPITGAPHNLLSLPPNLAPKHAEIESTWPRRQQDTEENVKRRMNQYRNLKNDLREAFKGKEVKGKGGKEGKGVGGGTGIIQEIEAEGLGEGDTRGLGVDLQKVFERVEGMLLRPVPTE